MGRVQERDKKRVHVRYIGLYSKIQMKRIVEEVSIPSSDRVADMLGVSIRP